MRITQPNVAMILVISLLFSCGTEKVQNGSLSRQLAGEWRNVDMKITMNSYQNSDSVRVFEVSEKDWEQKMRMKPIHTTFNADGTFRSPHVNLKDSIFYDPVGKWFIKGDTLIMEDTFPQRGLKYRYRVLISDDIAEFQGLEDCDNDGKADDLYIGRQRKHIGK